jgi:hypothetical protein
MTKIKMEGDDTIHIRDEIGAASGWRLVYRRDRG